MKVFLLCFFPLLYLRRSKSSDAPLLFYQFLKNILVKLFFRNVTDCLNSLIIAYLYCTVNNKENVAEILIQMKTRKKCTTSTYCAIRSATPDIKATAHRKFGSVSIARIVSSWILFMFHISSYFFVLI